MKNSKIFKTLFLISIVGLISSCSSKSTNNTSNTDTFTELISDSGKVDIDTEELVSTVDTSDYDYDIIDNWMKLGLDQETIINRLGEPEAKGKDEEWGALGTIVQQKNYPTKGISLEMESDKENEKKHVLMITLNAPATGKTSGLISIGSKKEDVQKAYSDRINPEFSDDESIVVESIFGGVIFTIENNVVTQIFIGAAAE